MVIDEYEEVVLIGHDQERWARNGPPHRKKHIKVRFILD